MTYIAQYKNCGSMVRSLTTTDSIPDLYGVCGLTEYSVLPSAPSETGDAGGEREQAASAGKMGVGVGVWVLVVAAWWVL